MPFCEPAETPTCRSRQFLFFLVASSYGLSAAACAVFTVSLIPPMAPTNTLLICGSISAASGLFGCGVTQACCCGSCDCSSSQSPVIQPLMG